ncbi:phosphatidylglycerol lysyltransferase domain-containing protein [Sphaerisporangium sp. TRM90804]|uniref:phosphatidylglycerol lysyltransferase domain-containing protein n=1 Tax=Sphaerisporangium sp. TRM90804 TaxID=3031113 RepID=UPI002447A5D9|nr:phosphatidylglycerol lysyltransferase domain-containing protein [Sphaerisporangium sp. TRM90804]MDH2424580.1 phosphatidylglycerol lysyltransferase domain-containing protein [Sphaerisporangium sp. TRM90804]
MAVTEQGRAGAAVAAGAGGRFRAVVPRALSVFMAAAAAYSAVIALVPPIRHALKPLSDLIETALFPVEPNLGYAVFLAILAGALARHKRAAYWVLVAIFVLLVLGDLAVVMSSSLMPDLVAEFALTRQVVASQINLVVSAAVLGVLAAAPDEFFAPMRRGSFKKALLTLASLLGVSCGVGYALVTFFPGSLRPGHHLPWALERALGGAASLDLYRSGRPPSWVNFVIGLFSAVAVLVAFAVLFRSQRARAELSRDGEERIRALLDAYGSRDSLGYFATRRDRAAIFSPSGKAAVSYRVVAGVCLAGGDPIGDVEAWAPAIRAWLEEARRYGWAPAVIGPSEAAAHAYARAGLRVLELGDEAVIEVGAFGLEGREMRGVRQAVNRIRRAGFTLRIRRHADLKAEELRLVADRAAAWRDTHAERGFSMALGRLGDPADGRCVLVEAFDAGDRPAAMLSLVPWGDDGLSLDLMRRDHDADNGLMEFMVAGLVAEAPELGVKRVSLNFAMFRSVFEGGARLGAGPVLRLWRYTLVFCSRWWQLESLYRANAKYRPQWVPRFLAFDDTRVLPKVGLASVIAEGFLAPPRLPSLAGLGRLPIVPGLPRPQRRTARRGARNGTRAPAGMPAIGQVPVAPADGSAAGGGAGGGMAS